jgi:hypothetical protein
MLFTCPDLPGKCEQLADHWSKMDLIAAQAA